jgi:hypothetical protein
MRLIELGRRIISRDTGSCCGLRTAIWALHSMKPKPVMLYTNKDDESGKERSGREAGRVGGTSSKQLAAMPRGMAGHGTTAGRGQQLNATMSPKQLR